MPVPSLISFSQAAYVESLNLLASISARSAPSAGCGSSLPSDLIPGAASINISLSSPLSSPNQTLQNRQYRIHLPWNFPPANDEPRPLLLTFNGQYQPTASIENYTKFSADEIVNPNAIAVYPEGVGNQWLGDVAAPPSSEINDVQFISDVLDDLEQRFCVDTNRIYGAGFSNGGGLTGLLACNGTVGQRFAALAAVAGSYYPDSALTEPLFGAGCGADREGITIPYLEIHGDSDKIVPYDGGNGTYVPATTFLETMGGLNGCDDDAVAPGGLVGAETNSTQELNGGNVTRYSWTCDGLQDVLVHYKVKGLGHGWPSTVYFGGILDEYRNGPTTWNASAVISDWFGRWTLRSAWTSVNASTVVES